MSESHDIALLADPNKIDVSTEPPSNEQSGKDETPFLFTQPSQTDKPAPTPAPTPSAPVIDLLDATQHKPVSMKQSESKDASKKPSGIQSNILDLSNVEMNETIKPVEPEMTPKQIQEKKEKILYGMERLRRRGVRFPRTFTMASNLSEMEAEFNRVKKDIETKQGVKFQRKMLMTCVSGIEMLNGKFDPFDVQLDGWSESVNENINDYDEIFEELYEKYRGTGKMAPEIRLLLTLGGSALMFHMTKSMFSKAGPELSDVLKQNPQLASKLKQAASEQMHGGGGISSGFSNLMGLAQSGGGESASAPPPRGVSIPEPDNVDDVLNELQGSAPPRRKKSGRNSKSSSGRSNGVDTMSITLGH